MPPNSIAEPESKLRRESKMYEVRFHGRGGQGAVTAANILAIAAFKEGKDHIGTELGQVILLLHVIQQFK